MLRLELRDSVLKLEGRLTAAGAEHIRRLMTGTDMLANMVVDITEVTFVDSVGEAVLSFLGRLGAEFVAETAYSIDVCERLDLSLAGKRTSQDRQSVMPRRSTRAHDA